MTEGQLRKESEPIIKTISKLHDLHAELLKTSVAETGLGKMAKPLNDDEWEAHRGASHQLRTYRESLNNDVSVLMEKLKSNEQYAILQAFRHI